MSWYEPRRQALENPIREPVGKPIQELLVVRERVERHGSRVPDG
jgi:hypothetical protein